LGGSLVHGGNFGREVLGGHSVLSHDNISGGGETELVNTDNLAGILVPKTSDTSLDSDALGARSREDGLFVVIRLALEGLHARHRDNTGSRQVGGGLEGVSDLRTGGKDNEFQVTRLLLGNVTSLQGSGTSLHVVHVSVLVDVLTREDQSSRTFLAGDGRNHGGDSLFGIGRSVDIKIGDNTKSRHSLDRLMGGSILTDTDRIVGKNVGNTVQLRKGSDTGSGTEIVNEDQESGSRDLEKTVETKSVHDGSHGVLTDTKVQVLSGVSLVESGSKVTSVVDVVTGGSVKIGRTRDVVRD